MKFYWHIHHNILIEPLVDALEKRIDYIRLHKPPDEVETRLTLLQPVKGELPPKLIKAGKAYDEAWNAYDEAWKAFHEAGEAYYEAWEAYDEVLIEHKEEVATLHRKECPDCPWDGTTIFPGREE